VTHRRPESSGPLPEGEAQRLIHELTVHQVELELQNEQLRESRADAEQAHARYADLYDFAPSAYLTVERDGTVHEANVASSELLSRDREALIGTRLGIFCVDSDRLNFDRFLGDVFTKRRASSTLKLGDDIAVPRRVQIDGVLMPDQQRCRVILTDITERHHAQETLRLRDHAIQGVSQGILISDFTQPDEPIIYANRGFELMTGYSAVDVIGSNCRFLQGPDTDAAAMQAMSACLLEGQSRSFEILNYRQDGRPFWNSLSLTPVHGDDGALIQYVGVMVDITERRRLEAELEHAQRMESIGRLAGGVAHDFNNLLTIINGYSEMLERDLPEGSPEQSSAHEIGVAGLRAAGLTRQLLAFSRRQLVDPKVLNLNQIVTDLVRMLGRLLGEDIRINLLLSPTLGRVTADAGQLEQVLINLAVNARDAMPTGGVLTISTQNIDLKEKDVSRHRGLSPGPHAVFTVTDTGIGMNETVKARLFEPFFTTKELGRGTGLGLATVYGIVQQSGGAISVTSEPGDGSTFEVWLPAAAFENAVKSVAASAAPRGTETILIVEDEPSVRRLTRHVLELHGYTVLEAESSEVALRIAEERDGLFSLLLTDVVMPKMGGRQLAEALVGRWPQLKVLYMSGYMDDAVLRYGVVESLTAFLQKPFLPAQLVWKVREVLDGSVVPPVVAP
jgi:two-component system cell cycle sensor histidine kinase/response regulator CckA